jgi:Fe-S cluster biogenesis protein NfuA/nitrite reductase/ring-hydroxylating ferredoxin subunit
MTGQQFQQRLQKVETLVRAIESSTDQKTRASAVELMHSLMELHGAGIERMVEIAFESADAGKQIIDRFASDELVATLLLLYGLHPVDLEARVMQALDKVRPYLNSHRGDVELLGITDGIVRLKLQGSCDGCASSSMTLKLAIEEAIYEAAPDVLALEVEGVTASAGNLPPSGLVQLERKLERKDDGTRTISDRNNGWSAVEGLEALVQGGVRTIQVSGRPVLFCRLGETLYAYSDACPECGHDMRSAVLEATALICPGCAGRFDVLSAGRGVDKPGVHLEPFPLLVERGQAKIALPSLQN